MLYVWKVTCEVRVEYRKEDALPSDPPERSGWVQHTDIHVAAGPYVEDAVAAVTASADLRNPEYDSEECRMVVRSAVRVRSVERLMALDYVPPSANEKQLLAACEAASDAYSNSRNLREEVGYGDEEMEMAQGRADRLLREAIEAAKGY